MENQNNKYKYFTGANILPYGLYFVRDNRDFTTYSGYTRYGEVLGDYMAQEMPDYTSSLIQQYMWQEGVENFTYFYFPVCDEEPDYFSSLYINEVLKSVRFDFVAVMSNIVENSNIGLSPIELFSVVRNKENPLLFEKQPLKIKKADKPMISAEALYEIYIQLMTQSPENQSLLYPNFINEVSYV